ncbi:putative WAP four-disulfide core domain protein 8 [Tripterygium wilfordii]|uniref:Putative WAP four-disulfide core domain protein 8 n=1 Tax=Tripterygium wilfordii TaxID=458696 RepID=A0A7J7C760_TRIWF|nr:putative WAP four-disulfide core domain protein 8 [Tripterygium wilfordii]
MKFEDLLVQQSEEQQMEQSHGEKMKLLHLEEEVVKLQEELDGEQALNKVLQCALQGPVVSHPCPATSLPPQVQELLAEMAMAEEEILWLERKIEVLKFSLYEEKKQTKEWQMQQEQQFRQRHQNHLLCGQDDRSVLHNTFHHLSTSQNYDHLKRGKTRSYRRASVGSASDIISMSSAGSRAEETHEVPRKQTRPRNHYPVHKEIGNDNPNELSEELIRCLIGIFLELNQATQDGEGSANVPKLGLSCMKSRGLTSKNMINHKAFLSPFNQHISNPDPYSIMTDLDGSVRDIGAYKNFIQITRSSLDISRFSVCSQSIRKLRSLMQNLCNVDLTFLTYKQKLAFWINIYNACIMHTFLEHGLPSTQDKLLTLMNKGALNVGGIVLNALAIEHFILRHPCESKHGPMDEKEMLLQHAYGLGYPEPNVTFALCRGSWSSPALRVFSPDQVVNELGKAKVEYLEASVGVTSKRKIIVPKLLQWHMQDFADDMESLLEWIYSQLPRSGSLKRLIMECLNGETRYSTTKRVEVQQYESEFRYLLPL